jgi:UDPglucose--hexose-1-phosphate uridylyltransferase
LSAALEFRATRKRARIHDPRREFALTEIESEVRYDPLSGDSARICHFAFPKRERPDLSDLVERTRKGCPFCPDSVERVTPRYPADLLPQGRLRRGEALLVPNLFPYDDVSAIVSMSQAHFLAMDAMPVAIVADALKLARDFIVTATPLVEAREAYGIVTWNYMPPSGASQVHPHLQVIVTDTPGNQLRRELDAATRFLSEQKRPYPAALLEAERGGARWLDEAGGVAWWVPYCPMGMLGDAQAMFVDQSTITACDDATLEAFAQGLCRLLAAYARMGQWSFNLTLLPDAQAEGSGRHRLTARLLPRFYLHPQLHNSDTAYLQLLLGEKFAMLTPEQHAADLRALLEER